MLKVWDKEDYRATMDIDFLAKISNEFDQFQKIIEEIATIPSEEDAVTFNTRKLILHRLQTGGEYEGISASFWAELDDAKIPILMDIGFNDLIIPEPSFIDYPVLLPLPTPKLRGYTLETVIAEKLECIVKRGLLNTRLKDFYDIWTLCRYEQLDIKILQTAIRTIFSRRGTQFEFPVSFTKAFYEAPMTIRRWESFIATIGKKPIPLCDIIAEITDFINPLISTRL